MADQLKQNGNIVAALESSLRSGLHGLDNVPGLLAQLLESGGWREFTTQRNEHVVHARFEDFVCAQPLKGLGTKLALVRQVIADDLHIVDLFDRATANPNGVHRAVNNVNGIKRPQGNKADAALRRLRKDRPDLHAEVLRTASLPRNERLSPHAAMIEAGFRKPTMTVAVDVDALVRAIQTYFTPDQIHDLIATLEESGLTGNRRNRE